MSKADEPRVNGQITAASIRLVDHNGNMVGVVSVSEGLKMAESANLDLVEVSPNASPPVCKILDYGKYKYEAQKKAHEARKKQKVIQIKEIKLRPTIDTHDLNIKIRNVLGFLNEGDKVRVTLRFRGREMDHQELGMQVLQRVQEALNEQCKIEQPPRMEGRQIVMTVAPTPK
jgi:translation initiation factor IF-3